MLARRPMLILLSLLVMGAGTPPAVSEKAPAALFWSQGHTWIVVTGAGARLWTARGWYAAADGAAFRYRIRVDAGRPAPGADGVPSPASRWARLERVRVGERAWVATTAAPALPGPGEPAIFDEETVLQFRGEAVTLARFRRGVGAGGEVYAAAGAETRVLEPAGGAFPAPPEPAAGEAGAADDGGPAGSGAAARVLGWFGAFFPGLVDGCVSRPVGRVALEEAGGRVGAWLVLGAAGGECAGQAHLLRLGAPGPARAVFGGLTWDGGRLLEAGRVRVADAVDVRPGPQGRRALVLAGAAFPGSGPVRRDLLGLDVPCARRRLLLWEAGAAEPVAVGEVARLDGLRWITDPAHPVVALLETHFRPADERCTAPVARWPDGPVTVDGALEEWPPEALAIAGRQCLVEEGARAWAGPEDLAAGVAARADEIGVGFVVRVQDPERADGDGVSLWFGGRRSAVRLDATGASTWSEDDLEAVRVDGEGGYVIEGRVTAALAGDPPALAVRIDDVDAPDERPQRLWAGGHPISAADRRPAPLVAVEDASGGTP